MNERSKYLSYLLRHKPETVGLALDREGWASVDELIRKTDFTLEELSEIVKTDDKKRYAIALGITDHKIRANQGHSTKQVRLTFNKAIPPVTLYHGTSYANVPTVMKEGLKPMKRHHVHLSADETVAADVAGRRKGSNTVLKIDAKRMLADGVQFFKSDNGVWLVDYVDPRYFVVIDSKRRNDR